MNPPATLVVCTRNRPGFLVTLLDSIFAATPAPSEIVVVDQSDSPHPTLATGAGAERGLRYLFDGAPGVSRGRNLGAREARTELVAFTDDDMLATPGWWAALVGALAAAGPKTAVVGRVSAENEGVRDGSYAPSITPLAGEGERDERAARQTLWSGNFAIRRSELLALGGFDERLGPGTAFPAAEDDDLARRLLDAGYRIVMVREAELIHRAWRTERDEPRLRFAYGRGDGACLAKHDDFTGGLRSLARGVLANLWEARRLRRPLRSCARLAYAGGMLVGACRWWLAHGAGGRAHDAETLAAGASALAPRAPERSDP